MKIKTASLFFGLFLFLAPQVFANQLLISEEFETDNANFSYNSDAHRDNTTGEMILMSECCGNAGSVFYNDSFNTSTFSVEFDFKIKQYSPDGADGFTFAVIDSSLGSNWLGLGGGGLGYKTLDPVKSFAVEFDVHKNPGIDYDYNHIGIDMGGNMESVALAQGFIPDMEDNGTFHVEINVKGGKFITVYLTNDSIGYPRTKIIDYKMEGMMPFDGLFGFTGGAGAFRDEFIIDSLKIQRSSIKN
jgi:hypothetical protein